MYRIPEIGECDDKILRGWINLIWKIYCSRFTGFQEFQFPTEEFRKKFLIYMFLIHQRMIKDLDKEFLDLMEFDKNLEKVVFRLFPGTIYLDVRYIENFQTGQAQELLDLVSNSIYNLYPGEEDRSFYLTTNDLLQGELINDKSSVRI